MFNLNAKQVRAMTNDRINNGDDLFIIEQVYNKLQTQVVAAVVNCKFTAGLSRCEFTKMGSQSQKVLIERMEEKGFRTHVQGGAFWIDWRNLPEGTTHYKGVFFYKADGSKFIDNQWVTSDVCISELREVNNQ